jgi:hypothetical protein
LTDGTSDGTAERPETWQNPLDTPAGAATRFAVEVAAWVVVPWAVGRAVGWIPAAVALVAILAATGTFNAASDKPHEGVTVPGRARLALEAALGIGVVAAGYLWGAVGAALIAALVVAAGVAGRRRSAWLLRGGAAGA